MRVAPFTSLDPASYREIVRLALVEDVRWGDVTTEAVVPPELQATGVLVVSTPCVLAGLDVATECFRQLDPHVVIDGVRRDGERCESGTELARLRGGAAALLTAERTALNFLQRLCGIATRTRDFVDAGRGRTTVLDTRRTTPSLRALEAYAVRVGGGVNHRVGLDDGVLVGANHVRMAGSIAEAVRRMRAADAELPIEAEVHTLDDVDAALEAGVATVRVDGLAIEVVREAVRRSRGRAKIAVSGPVPLDRMSQLAQTGAEYVSIAALTQAATQVEMTLELVSDVAPQTRSVASRVGDTPRAASHLVSGRVAPNVAATLGRCQVLLADLDARLRPATARLGPFGGRVRHYRQVRSTNDVAAKLADQGAAHGTVVVADAQTAGRGRHGNHWFSPADGGLYVSVLLRTVSAPVVTLAAGVAVAEALSVGGGLETTLEWPNDVVVVAGGRPRKVAGVLAEATTVRDRVERVIVGIGVNLREAVWPAELADQVGSVEGLTGRRVDRAHLLVELLAALATRCAEIESGAVSRLLTRWEALAPSSRGAMVEWLVGSVRHRGVTEGVDEHGALLVRVGTRLERLAGGEVHHVR